MTAGLPSKITSSHNPRLRKTTSDVDDEGRAEYILLRVCGRRLTAGTHVARLRAQRLEVLHNTYSAFTEKPTRSTCIRCNSIDRSLANIRFALAKPCEYAFARIKFAVANIQIKSNPDKFDAAGR